MSIGRIARQGANYVGRLLFDDKFSSHITSRLQASQRVAKAKGGKWYKNLHNQVGDAFVTAERRCAKSGGVFAGLKKSLSDFIPGLKNVWKSKGGFLGKLGKSLKFLGKKLPIIGTALMVAFEIPNIVKATKDGGLIKGLAEAGKSALRLAAGIGLGAVGAAFLGPVGAIAGFIVGDLVGKLVVGKSYSEKQAEKEEQLAQAQEQQQAAGGTCTGGSCSSGGCGGIQPTFAGNTPQVQPQQQPGAINPFIQYQMALEKQSFANPYQDDIMYNLTFNQPQRLNYQA